MKGLRKAIAGVGWRRRRVGREGGDGRGEGEGKAPREREGGGGGERKAMAGMEGDGRGCRGRTTAGMRFEGSRRLIRRSVISGKSGEGIQKFCSFARAFFGQK